MEDQKLVFDRKKHLLYSAAAKRVIQTHLQQHYPGKQAEELWEQIQRAYVEILEEIPYLGGKKNMQASSVYDCAALFAYYRAVPEKPDLEEFEQMNTELFVHVSDRKWGKPNLNHRLLMKAAGCIWSSLARGTGKHKKDWPGNYIMEMQPAQEGVRYVFWRCPIAELARRLGYEKLMPAMCNPDYPIIKEMGAGLIRTRTCGFSDRCDYWIVGDRSEELKKHPAVRNEDGYLVNR